jgi:hypothetical protein
MKVTVIMALALLATYRFVKAVIKGNTAKTLIAAGEIMAITQLGLWAM